MPRWCVAAIAAACLAPGAAAAVAADGTISTVAGGGYGNRGPAVEASLFAPGGVVAGPGGTTYVASRGHVRRVEADGTITNIAGDGRDVSHGDGGPATRAGIAQAAGIDVAADGALLVAERFAVRRVVPGGTITTVAGGRQGSSGDGGPATEAGFETVADVAALPDGGFLVADRLGNRIHRVDARGTIRTVAGTGAHGSSGDGGAATQAQLAGPVAVEALPDGGFLIADQENARVRRVSPGGTITTVASTFSQPSGLVALPDGGFLVSLGAEVVRYAPDGTRTTVAGVGFSGDGGDGGPATEATLRAGGLALRPDGTVLIADQGNHRLRAIDGEGIIRTIAGSGQTAFAGDGRAAVDAGLSGAVSAEDLPDGSVLVADQFSLHVRRIDPEGRITTVAGTGRPCLGRDETALPAADACLDQPRSLAALSDGAFLVAHGPRVVRVAASGEFRIVAGSGDGRFAGDGGPATAAGLDPEDLAALPGGGFLVADQANHRVRRVDADGTITTVAGTGTDGASFGTGDGPATERNLSRPSAVAVLPDGAFLIADTGNGRIRKVDAAGSMTTVAGAFSGLPCCEGAPATEVLLNPTDVAVEATGTLLVVEAGSIVRRIGADGRIRTVAGDFESASVGRCCVRPLGDGGAATAAGLSVVGDVAPLADGGFLIADNDRVRRVTAGTPAPDPDPDPDPEPDPEPAPSLLVADVSVKEGRSGEAPATFVLTLSRPSTTSVRVPYATAADTATVGSDFRSMSGTVTFAAGEVQKTVSVPVLGDRQDEPDETFRLELGVPEGATAVDRAALGTIVDDDPAPKSPRCKPRDPACTT